MDCLDGLNVQSFNVDQLGCLVCSRRLMKLGFVSGRGMIARYLWAACLRAVWKQIIECSHLDIDCRVSVCHSCPTFVMSAGQKHDSCFC